MVLGLMLGLVAIGVFVISLRVVMAYNRFKEIRRDSERER